MSCVLPSGMCCTIGYMAVDVPPTNVGAGPGPGPGGDCSSNSSSDRREPEPEPAPRRWLSERKRPFRFFSLLERVPWFVLLLWWW